MWKFSILIEEKSVSVIGFSTLTSLIVIKIFMNIRYEMKDIGC